MLRPLLGVIVIFGTLILAMLFGDNIETATTDSQEARIKLLVSKDKSMSHIIKETVTCKITKDNGLVTKSTCTAKNSEGKLFIFDFDKETFIAE